MLLHSTTMLTLLQLCIIVLLLLLPPLVASTAAWITPRGQQPQNTWEISSSLPRPRILAAKDPVCCASKLMPGTTVPTRWHSWTAITLAQFRNEDLGSDGMPVALKADDDSASGPSFSFVATLHVPPPPIRCSAW